MRGYLILAIIPVLLNYVTPGVTTIYAATGCGNFWGSFFEQKINFGVSFLAKSQVFRKITL